jgi:hypothetical protein
MPLSYDLTTFQIVGQNLSILNVGILTFKKTGFFDIFFQFFQFFKVCAFLGQYLRKNSKVLFVAYFCEFFDTPGTPGSASIYI